MNLNQFEYLLAIYEQGSITKAAQKLFVSAPAISKMIHGLEDELGYKLLNRLANKVEFTDKGIEAISVLQEIQTNITRLKQIGEIGFELHGEFMLGSATFFTCSMMVPFVIKMHNEYENLKLNLQSSDSDTIISFVGQDKVDIGMVLICTLDAPILFREIKRNQLEFEELFEDELCFVVRKDHPLFRKPAITIYDVFQYPYICYVESVNQYVPDFFEMLLSDLSKKGNINQYKSEVNMIRINDRESLYELLTLTDGMTLIPRANASFMEKRYPNLCYLPVLDERLTCKVGLIYKKNTQNQDKKILVEELKKELKKY